MPGGCKYFSERAAPQVGPNGSKVHNKKNFDLLGHPKPKLCPIESTKKGDIPPPPVGKRGSSFKDFQVKSFYFGNPFMNDMYQKNFAPAAQQEGYRFLKENHEEGGKQPKSFVCGATVLTNPKSDFSVDSP